MVINNAVYLNMDRHLEYSILIVNKSNLKIKKYKYIWFRTLCSDHYNINILLLSLLYNNFTIYVLIVIKYIKALERRHKIN